MSLPQELKLREDRLAVMATAKAKIAARAAQRYAREKAEFDEKISKREAKAKETGKSLAAKCQWPQNRAPKTATRSI